MIQHIKKKKHLLICLFAYLFVYSSCNSKKESKKNEKTEVTFELKTEGKWKLVKSAKSGVWKKDIEYTYNQEQLKGKHTKTVINFSRDYIIIDNESYCSGNNVLINESLDFNLIGTDEDRKKLKLFLKEKFGLKENDFRGLYSLNCEHPFNKIFDFGNKLLVREWGAYYYLFEKTKEKKQDVKVVTGYDCKEVELKTSIYDEPLYNICVCDFDFSKCYGLFYNKSDDYYRKLLLQNLPKNDTVVYFGRVVNTEYKFYKNDSIGIKIQEDGGGSDYIFKKINNKTVIDFYAYPP